jgi:transcriptional regulator with XRE-family HTH domain
MSSIGNKIREVRKKNGLTLNELAELTGLSQGFLSQVERSKSSITLQSLSKISDALEVSRSYFFEDVEDEENHSTGVSSKIAINNEHDINFFYKSLAGNIDQPIFEPMLAVLLPEERKPSASSHYGEEFAYVLEGELTLIIEDEELTLSEGKSFHISSSTPHTWFNNTDSVVKLLYIHANM